MAVDVREACRSQRAGKGQWTYGLVSELLRREQELILLCDSPLPSEWEQYSPKTKTFRSGVLWHVRAFLYFVGLKQPSMYVSLTSFIVPFFLPKKYLCIPVVHDLIAFRPDIHNKKATIIERLLAKGALRKAAHILTVSTSTKNDLLKQFPSLSETAITPIFAGPVRESAAVSESNENMILCVATLSPRKNQYRLLQAYASLPENLRKKYKLVLAGGRGWNDNNIVRLAQETDGADFIGYIDEQQYRDLLHSCAVLALPSLYEGFGMQVLDALQRGVPVLTSDRGSLSEVAGDSALLVDPEDVRSIASGLSTILTNESVRSRLRTQGPVQAGTFSWKRTADLFLNIVKVLQ